MWSWVPGLASLARDDNGWHALLLLPLLLADPVPAHAASAVDPSIGRVEVTLDLPKDKPYVGEMIILRMRSFIRANILLNEVRQPPLTNFSWQQLGRDKPIEAMVDGFRVSGIERDLAIFPTSSGRLIIEPFVRHVSVAGDDNQPVQTDFASKPVYVDVQNFTAINPPGQWWMPAKEVSITETWSQVPDEIKPGTLSRRTITVAAVGLTGERLPPPPDMRAPGTIAFRGPVDRQTVITEDGPIAKGVYEWDIRPVSSSPAKLPAVHVAWFDTEQRRMRDAALPDLWLAYVGTLVHASHEKIKSIGLLSPGPLVAGLVGFAWTAALVGFVLTARRPPGRAALRRARALAALRKAARNADTGDFDRALIALDRSDPARWAAVSRDPAVAPRLAARDTARYGRSGGTAPPLGPLAADIRRLWLAAAPAETGALAPLQGW